MKRKTLTVVSIGPGDPALLNQVTLDELRKDFEEGIDSYLEGCKADGVEPAKPYSGKLNLRM